MQSFYIQNLPQDAYFTCFLFSSHVQPCVSFQKRRLRCSIFQMKRAKQVAGKNIAFAEAWQRQVEPKRALHVRWQFGGRFMKIKTRRDVFDVFEIFVLTPLATIGIFGEHTEHMRYLKQPSGAELLQWFLCLAVCRLLCFQLPCTALAQGSGCSTATVFSI